MDWLTKNSAVFIVNFDIIIFLLTEKKFSLVVQHSRWTICEEQNCYCCFAIIVRSICVHCGFCFDGGSWSFIIIKSSSFLNFNNICVCPGFCFNGGHWSFIVVKSCSILNVDNIHVRHSFLFCWRSLIIHDVGHQCNTIHFLIYTIYSRLQYELMFLLKQARQNKVEQFFELWFWGY